ncbi:MAG: hypothetical protein OXQ32_05375 [bacterium]|nr:hypothetical protein [bacterium]
MKGPSAHDPKMHHYRRASWLVYRAAGFLGVVNSAQVNDDARRIRSSG